MPYSDFPPYICKYIRSQWQLFWDTQTGKKLHQIHPKIGLWKSSLQLSCKDQALLTRCRIGRSRLTHLFLLNNEPVPECVFSACPLTIRHGLLECADHVQTSFYCDSNILVPCLCLTYFLMLMVKLLWLFLKPLAKLGC